MIILNIKNISIAILCDELCIHGLEAMKKERFLKATDTIINSTYNIV
jgi:hypothetical protein